MKNMLPSLRAKSKSKPISLFGGRGGGEGLIIKGLLRLRFGEGREEGLRYVSDWKEKKFS